MHACCIFFTCVLYQKGIYKDSLSVVDFVFPQFQTTCFIITSKWFQHADEEAPAALCFPCTHSGWYFPVLYYRIIILMTATIDSSVCVVLFVSCRGQHMLPETSWKHRGLPGSMLVLSRTVLNTSDFC